MREIYKSALLLFISCFVYIGTLEGEFVFDDSEAVLNNKDVSSETHWTVMIQNDFWGTNVKSNMSHKSYRPFTIWTFRMNKFLSGNNLIPYSFKLTNLIIHMITVQLVNSFLTVLFPDLISISLKSLTVGRASKHLPILNDVPYMATLLFAVHPVHVEAVSGIVGRADVLSALFFFLTLIFYFISIPPREKGMEDDNSTSRLFYKWLSVICVFVFAHLATYSKELGLMAVIMCSVYDIVIINGVDLRVVLIFLKLIDLSSEERRETRNEPVTITNIQWTRFGKKHKNVITRLLLMFVFLIYFILSRLWFLNYQGPLFQKTDNPAAFSENILTRILTYNYIYFMNILILIWPQWLCFDWSMGCISLLESMDDPRILCILLLWIFLFVLLYGATSHKSRPQQRRMITMALCLLVIPFLPASNLIVTVGLVVAERILYIPSLGMCLLVALGAHTLMWDTKDSIKKLAKLSFIGILIFYSLRTNIRGKQWKREYDLYNSALEVCPLNAKVHYNIAKLAGDTGDLMLAKEEYRIALEMYPEYYQAMNNLANILKNLGNYKEAEVYLEKALSIKGDFPAAWMNLGIVLGHLNKPKQAEEAYMTALKYRRDYPDCYFNIGNLYLEQNLHELALSYWMKAINLNPKHETAWNNILSLLYNTDQIKRGLTFTEQALRLNPTSPNIHYNVANMEGKAAKFEIAEQHFLTAIRLSEKNPQSRYYSNLGVLYHRWEKYDKAKDMYIKAYQLNNKSKSVVENLRKLPNVYESDIQSIIG